MVCRRRPCLSMYLCMHVTYPVISIDRLCRFIGYLFKTFGTDTLACWCSSSCILLFSIMSNCMWCMCRTWSPCGLEYNNKRVCVCRVCNFKSQMLIFKWGLCDSCVNAEMRMDALSQILCKWWTTSNCTHSSEWAAIMWWLRGLVKRFDGLLLSFLSGFEVNSSAVVTYKRV